jgi:hypothetical protein
MSGTLSGLGLITEKVPVLSASGHPQYVNGELVTRDRTVVSGNGQVVFDPVDGGLSGEDQNAQNAIRSLLTRAFEAASNYSRNAGNLAANQSLADRVAAVDGRGATNASASGLLGDFLGINLARILMGERDSNGAVVEKHMSYQGPASASAGGAVRIDGNSGRHAAVACGNGPVRGGGDRVAGVDAVRSGMAIDGWPLGRHCAQPTGPQTCCSRKRRYWTRRFRPNWTARVGIGSRSGRKPSRRRGTRWWRAKRWWSGPKASR